MKNHGLLFDQFINGTWEFVGISLRLRSGYEARIHTGKPGQFPVDWYSRVFEALGHDYIDFEAEDDRILLRRIRSVFLSGFTAEELISVLHLQPKNPIYWRSNITSLLAKVRNEEERRAYQNQTLRISGMERITDILKRTNK